MSRPRAHPAPRPRPGARARPLALLRAPAPQCPRRAARRAGAAKRSWCSDTKIGLSVHYKDAKQLLIAHGAVESVLRRCSHIKLQGQVYPLTEILCDYAIVRLP